MTRPGEKIQENALAVLRRRRDPLSAYDILRELRESNPKIAPTTIYRALAALTESGRVHRLESLNAFMACQCGRHQHNSILSICDSCGGVEESVAPDFLKGLSRLMKKTGFKPERYVIEIHGLCASCHTEQAPR